MSIIGSCVIQLKCKSILSENHVLTPIDLFLTFDPKLMIDFFSKLINAHKKKVVPSKSEHVLRFSPVKFNDL